MTFQECSGIFDKKSEKNMSAFADHANHDTKVSRAFDVNLLCHFCDFKIYEVNELMKQKNGFSGQLGFVFAAAGSAVGVVGSMEIPIPCSKRRRLACF